MNIKTGKPFQDESLAVHDLPNLIRLSDVLRYDY